MGICDEKKIKTKNGRKEKTKENKKLINYFNKLFLYIFSNSLYLFSLII